jgi:hypothetical protein
LTERQSKANNGAILREAPMPATIGSLVTADRNRRRERAERAAQMPPEVLRAHNLCVSLLGELEPQVALAVVQRIQRSLVEFLATRAHG